MSCLVCGAQFQAPANLIVHQVLYCNECLSEFEVTDTEPLTLVELPPNEEDWGQ